MSPSFFKPKQAPSHVTKKMLRADSDEDNQKIAAKKRKVANPDSEVSTLRCYYRTPFHGVDSKGKPDVSSTFS
jgi:hypothetical protein